jgi:hypothetical protein
MEGLLNAQTHNAVGPLAEFLSKRGRSKRNFLDRKTLVVHPLRSDVYRADLDEQKEQRDLVNIDFEQLYWESIPEDSKVSLNQPFPFPCSPVDSVPLRNLFFPIPYKKLKRLLLSGRREERQKKMPNSCIVYQTQSLSRLLPTKF